MRASGTAGPTGTAPLRAAIYYRVSSEEQIDGFSLDAQRRALVEFCQSKGWQVVEEYADEGKSARGDNIDTRPAFRKMMDDAEAGYLDVVAVHKLDRFSRSMRVTFDSLARLKAAGVTFTTVAESQFDFTTPMGQVMMALLAAFAQYYSDNLSTETKKGKAERKAQGLWNGHIPFGMMKGEAGLPVADPATIDGLRLAFNMAADGASDRDIAQALNAAGYRTTGAKGQPNSFQKDTVAAMMQNRFYLGELPGAESGTTVPGQHGPVIDGATFGLAQDARERRASSRRSSVTRGATTYSLSGLGICGECGSRLHIQPGKGSPYVYCSGRRQGGACKAKGVGLAQIEDQLARYLASFTIPPDYRERMRQHLADVAEGRAIVADDSAAQRQRLTLRLGRIKEMYGWGDMERAAYLAERDNLLHELAALDARATDGDTHLALLAAQLANAAAQWGDATGEERNRLARAVFEAVIVKDGVVTAVKQHPELAGFFALDTEARGLDDTDSFVPCGSEARHFRRLEFLDGPACQGRFPCPPFPRLARTLPT